ncbi:hypothetical protein HKBW3C_02956 [Candidatus Hakubella thermalkaliphila]|nr:hypothetical protein HKBW3C_02956 [Candidatus Hakubella thermalkaliphila]
MANYDAKLLLELAQMRMWDKVDEAFTWILTITLNSKTGIPEVQQKEESSPQSATSLN